jgi:glycosyltransferase involved in cell wall biosynthesis
MMKINNPNCSVIVPVFNAEKTIPLLAERLQPVLKASFRRYELILVNDGSQDGSWQEIIQLTHIHPWISGINLARNFGQHNALLCGIRQARYDLVVTMDDDLQNPPEEIPRLLARFQEGYDVVYGTPRLERHSFWRSLASQVTKLALKGVMGVETARKVSAFRLFRTQIREAFTDLLGPSVNIDVLLTWGTNRFTSIPVDHEERTLGVSNYAVGMLIRHALNMLTGFTTLPLQLASITGFVFFIFGFLVLVYVIGRYFLQGTSVPGFPFLASIIAIFSGAQLFALGIIGEYLARMYSRVMNRPSFAIRSKVVHGLES